jgi:capsular polysaccharide biosynthesis protein
MLEALHRAEPKLGKSATRVFIRRNARYRILRNEREIEDELVARGFTVVEPEKLSFAEQVETFSNALVIIGATGAACANMLFAPPQARLIIMLSDYPHNDLYYWPAMMRAVGNTITYVVGRAADGTSASVHADYVVALQDVLYAIVGSE